MLTKEIIRDRLRVKSVWLLTTRTPFFVAGEEHMQAAADRLSERYIRYIVCLLFQGNAITNQSGKIEQVDEDGNYIVKWSDVQIAPAAMPQIPEGSYDIEDPVIAIEGGTNLYGHVNGNSINLSVTYWDWEI